MELILKQKDAFLKLKKRFGRKQEDGMQWIRYVVLEMSINCVSDVLFTCLKGKNSLPRRSLNCSLNAGTFKTPQAMKEARHTLGSFWSRLTPIASLLLKQVLWDHFELQITHSRCVFAMHSLKMVAPGQLKNNKYTHIRLYISF